MRRLLALLLLFVGLNLATAEAKTPVEEDILERITDSASPYYYPKLLLRLEQGDPTLSDEDFHYLYYGYAYQESYKPLATNPDMERMLELLTGLDPDHAERSRIEELIIAANGARESDPFSPQVLNVLTYAYEQLGDKAKAEQWARAMNGVLRAIVASGDGLTQRTPRHILMFDHALSVMAAEGYPHGKARIVSRDVEFIPLASSYVIDGKKRKGFYYDFSRIYRNKPEGYTYKRDRTWQFNNLKPREYK
ncbi:MAG: DUF4919 domain-containing protein [Alistipes sp.]|nr:DUF4919 domain-containing protein [Alistipes sp.]